MPAIFTQEDHPDLMHVVLKGDLLQEFVRYLTDTIEFGKKSFAKMDDVDPMKQLTLDMFAIQGEVISNITKGLNSDGAKQFGIDAADLRRLIEKATSVDARKVHAGGIFDKTVAAAVSQEDGEKNFLTNEAATQAAAKNLLEVFCQCIAVQEGREKDYLPLAKEGISEELAPFYALKEQLAAIPEEVSKPIREEALKGLAILIVSQSHILQMLKDRSSPLAGLLGKMMGNSASDKGGFWAQTAEAAANLLNLDTAKNTDRETVRRHLKTACEQVANQLQLTMPKELGL